MSTQFARTLTAWRRANNIKQATLAAELGVSQQALSAWERGLCEPSAQIMGQLRSVIGRGDPLAVELAFARGQSCMKALVDVDGIRLIGYSAGFEQVWRPFCVMKGERLQDRLTNELKTLVEGDEARRQIIGGDLVVVSGVSDRHVDIDLGGAFRHRWHVCFRRYGPRVIADMLFEPCQPDHPVGIDTLIRADDVSASFA